MKLANIQNKAITHVEICPMKDVGDVWAITFVNDADYFNAYYATAGVPAVLIRAFDNIDEALESIKKDPSFASVPCWFNGYEVMEEIASREDIIFALCASESHDDESLIDHGERLGFTASETEALIAAYQREL